jgi:hypothetical protein
VSTFGNFSVDLDDRLNASEADLLNLHWISQLLTIRDIGKLKKPLVWILRAMWAFCGGEHYALNDQEAWFREGYRPHCC